MHQRGRKREKSGGEKVVTGVFAERPAPPEDLTLEQATEWRTIVDRMPLNWFTAETWPMLAQLCGHITGSRLLRRELKEFDAGIPKYPQAYLRYRELKNLYDREGNSIARLMTKLRLTPQSRCRADKAFTAVQNTPPGPKPWDR